MPRGDGTGPQGRGPMTGRGMGYCVVPLSNSTGIPSRRLGTTGNRSAGPADSSWGTDVLRSRLTSIGRQLADIEASLTLLSERRK